MSNRDVFAVFGCLIGVGCGTGFKAALLFGACVCVRNKGREFQTGRLISVGGWREIRRKSVSEVL